MGVAELTKSHSEGSGTRVTSFREPKSATETFDYDVPSVEVVDDDFGAFFDRHADDVLAYFYRRTGDPHTAADLMAETFAEALLSRSKFEAKRGSSRAWLFGIARHELLNWIRKGRVRDRALAKLGMQKIGVDDVSLERIESIIDLTERVTLLDAAMQRLSPPIAEAVTLRIGHDLSFEEVAQRLGCSAGAARVRVSRGLSQLADELER